jgi:hypothetical protein
VLFIRLYLPCNIFIFYVIVFIFRVRFLIFNVIVFIFGVYFSCNCFYDFCKVYLYNVIVFIKKNTLLILYLFDNVNNKRIGIAPQWLRHWFIYLQACT